MPVTDANTWLEAATEGRWPILDTLRKMVLSVGPGIIEEFKWGRPCSATAHGLFCYLHRTKHHVTLGFQHGAELKDPKGLLEAALALCGGPLLPRSEAPGVLEAREELPAPLKATLLAQGSPQHSFETALQEYDPEFWEAALARLPTADPRRLLLETRLSRFLESY